MGRIPCLASPTWSLLVPVPSCGKRVSMQANISSAVRCSPPPQQSLKLHFHRIHLPVLM